MLTNEQLFSKPIEQLCSNQVIKYLDINDLLSTDSVIGAFILDMLEKVTTTQIMENGEGYIQRIDEINDSTDIKTTLNIFKDKITFRITKETYYTQDEPKSISPGVFN